MKILLLLITVLLPLSGWAESYQHIVITEFGDPEVLQLVSESSLPEPGPAEVRLRVLTASASFTDVMVRKGQYGEAPTEPPLVPGYDLVGVIDKLGPDVIDFEIGQRVAALTVWGAYTEYAIQPVTYLVPVPEELGDEAAVALILSYTTAYQMLHRVAHVSAGQTVLIHGASGAVGTALAQLGKVAELNMVGTASTRKQDYVRSLGVHPIDYKTEDFVSRSRELTGKAGVDVAFDAIGLENFKRSYETLNPTGELVLYGLYTATLTGEAGSMSGLIGEFLGMKWQQLLWDWFPDDNKTTQFYSITDMRSEHPDWFLADLATLFKLAVTGQITPRIWKTMPLAEAAESHRYIEDHAVEGKIVLRISGSGKQDVDDGE
jgi:NADPH:quinone reductase-like Zn-dependent oxidoreductase